jgi:hypothetical protein
MEKPQYEHEKLMHPAFKAIMDYERNIFSTSYSDQQIDQYCDLAVTALLQTLSRYFVADESGKYRFGNDIISIKDDFLNLKSFFEEVEQMIENLAEGSEISKLGIAKRFEKATYRYYHSSFNSTTTPGELLYHVYYVVPGNEPFDFKVMFNDIVNMFYRLLK